MKSQPKTIFRLGAEQGLIMGGMLMVVFLLFSFCYYGPVSLLFLASLIAVPVLCYRLMRRTFVRSHGLATFSATWMNGIMTMICGSIVLTLVAFIFLRWIYPDFWVDWIGRAQEMALESRSDQMADMCQEMRQALEAGVFEPMSIALSFGWLGASTGSLLALLLTPLVRRKPVNFDVDNND